jgi:hypothetical protein
VEPLSGCGRKSSTAGKLTAGKLRALLAGRPDISPKPRRERRVPLGLPVWRDTGSGAPTSTSSDETDELHAAVLIEFSPLLSAISSVDHYDHLVMVRETWVGQVEMACSYWSGRWNPGR